MAVTNHTDFKVYNEQYATGIVEVLARNINVFNEASGGAIRLESAGIVGSHEIGSFYSLPAGLVQDRDNDSDDPVTPLKQTQSEVDTVKKNYRIGPVDSKLDAFKKIGADSMEEMAYVLGTQAAPEIMNKMLQSGIAALVGVAKLSAGAVVYDQTAETAKTMVFTTLANARARLGDAYTTIRCWVMHSVPFHQLVLNQHVEKLLEVTAGVLYGASPATLGLPVLVTDSPALFDAGTSASNDQVFWGFGLTDDALAVIESEERSIVMQYITGGANLKLRYQGEGAYNLGVKGQLFSKATSNPTDAALATSTNWVKSVQSWKNSFGVAFKTQAPLTAPAL